MNPPSQASYPAGSPPPNENLYQTSSNSIGNRPAQGQHVYYTAPYAPQVGSAGFQPQNQNQNQSFQQNPNRQQHPHLQQRPLQQAAYQQQMSSLQQPALPQQFTWRRFLVLTNSDAISSGFPFHPQLYNLQVKQEEWHEFTTEIIESAKLSASEDAAAWSAGVSVGAASSAFLLVFGPPIGYYTGKAIHKKTVVKKVKERMLENGEISVVLNKWNQRNFKWRGFQVWLECPADTETIPGMSKKEAKKFKLVVMPASEMQESFSSAPWSQAQPGLVEAPSVAPQRPVELQNTFAQNLSPQHELLKGAYPTPITQVHAASELDGHDTMQPPQPMLAELSG